MIKVSAPGKIHLLGEHAVVYGKPALLAAVDLRVTVSIRHPRGGHRFAPQDNTRSLKRIIESIIKKQLKIKQIPPYKLEIFSQLPIGSGLGSSAAVSAAYIDALLTFLKIKWDLNLINKLSFEAEKVFHGNPSGGDNSTVVFGGLVWFRKETDDFRIILPLSFSIDKKLAENFVLIDSGKPHESTGEMVGMVRNLYKKQPELVDKFLNDQEKLTQDLLQVIKDANEKEFIRIIREGERNLESIGVVSSYAKGIIRQIEKSGGAGKICGGGGKTKGIGILLAYHHNKKVLEKIAKKENLPYFSTSLGVEGLRQEKL